MTALRSSLGPFSQVIRATAFPQEDITSTPERRREFAKIVEGLGFFCAPKQDIKGPAFDAWFELQRMYREGKR